MLDMAEDIRSLTEFKRNTSELMDHIRETGNPLVLTVNGRAEIVVQDARAYQELLNSVERARDIQGISRGIEDLQAGRVKPLNEAFAEIRRGTVPR